jgi:uncharacterized coiled-coil DUF342 family protein
VHTTPLLIEKMSSPVNQVSGFTKKKQTLIHQANEYLNRVEKYEAETRKFEEQARQYWAKVPKGPTYYYQGYADQLLRCDAENEANARQYDTLADQAEQEMRRCERLAYEACRKLSPLELANSGLQDRLHRKDQALSDQVRHYEMEASQCRGQAYQNLSKRPEFEVKIREFEDKSRGFEDKARECEAEIAKLQCQLRQYQEQARQYKRDASNLKYQAKSCGDLAPELNQKAEESEALARAIRERIYFPM